MTNQHLAEAVLLIPQETMPHSTALLVDRL
jgi:hypothetical protein